MNPNLTINKYNLMMFFILLCSILPVLKASWFSMPILYLLIPIQMFLLLFILLGKIKVPNVTKIIITMFTLIIIEVLISGIYGSMTYLNSFVFPTDIIQYVARFLVIIMFIIIFFYKKVELNVFIRYFLIFLNIAMLIGILQWIPWPGRELLIKLYPFRDGIEQLSQLSRSLSGRRIHGVAQMATANGGLATFFFIIGLSFYKYFDKYRKLSIVLMVLSIINVFASQARAGILALVCSLILFYFIDIYIKGKGFKETLKFFGVFLFTSLIIWILYINENSVLLRMIYRWEVLFETDGGHRVLQVKYFLSLLNNGMSYIFGLSKPVINQSDMSFGVEIEPVYIFVLYGIAGFILQYLLVGYLIIYFFKKMKKSIQNKAILALIVAAFIGLISYQVFSVAYYFFREVRVGLFPWILMGVAIGSYERYQRDRIKKNIN